VAEAVSDTGTRPSAASDWLDLISEAISKLIPREFTGVVEISVFKGGIANVATVVRQTRKGGKKGRL
jgi:hypothetical protein